MINQIPTPTPTDNFPVPTPTNIPLGSSEILWSNQHQHKDSPTPAWNWYCTLSTCGCIEEDGGGYGSLSECETDYEAYKCSDICKNSSDCCDETPTPTTPSPTPRYDWYCSGPTKDANGCGCIEDDDGGFASKAECDADYEANKCSDMCDTDCCCEDCFYNAATGETNCGTGTCKCDCPLCQAGGNSSGEILGGCDCDDCFVNVATGETNCGTGECSCECDTCNGVDPCLPPTSPSYSPTYPSPTPTTPTKTGTTPTSPSPTWTDPCTINNGQKCCCDACYWEFDSTCPPECCDDENECKSYNHSLSFCTPSPTTPSPTPSSPSPSPTGSTPSSPSPSSPSPTDTGSTPSSPSPTDTGSTPSSPSPTPTYTPNCDPIVDGPCAVLYDCDNTYQNYGCSKDVDEYYGYYNQPGSGCVVFTFADDSDCSSGSNLDKPEGDTVDDCNDLACQPTPTSPSPTESNTPSSPSPTESNTPSTPSPTETCTPECSLYMPCSSQTASDLIVEYKCSGAATAFYYNQECHIQSDGIVDCGNIFFDDAPGTPIVGCNDTVCNPPTSPTPTTPSPTTPTPTSPSDTPTSPTPTPTPTPSPTPCDETVVFLTFKEEETKPYSGINISGVDTNKVEYYVKRRFECNYDWLCPLNDCFTEAKCDPLRREGSNAVNPDDLPDDAECECSDINIAEYKFYEETEISSECEETCTWSVENRTISLHDDPSCSLDQTVQNRYCCENESNTGNCNGGGSCTNPTQGLTFSIDTVKLCGSCAEAWGSGCSTGKPPEDEDQPDPNVFVPFGVTNGIYVDFSGGTNSSYQDTSTGAICDPSSATGYCYSQTIDISGSISCSDPTLTFSGTATGQTDDKVCTTTQLDDLCGSGGNVSSMGAMATASCKSHGVGKPPYDNNTPCTIPGHGATTNNPSNDNVSLDSVNNMRDIYVQQYCVENPTNSCCKKIKEQMNWVTNIRNNPCVDSLCDNWAGCPEDVTEDISAEYTFSTCDTTTVDLGSCYTTNWS